MITAYLIPVDGRTVPQMADAICLHPIEWHSDERNLVVCADGYVELDGVIPALAGMETVTRNEQNQEA